VRIDFDAEPYANNGDAQYRHAAAIPDGWLTVSGVQRQTLLLVGGGAPFKS
jgi:hypothetical protein